MAAVGKPYVYGHLSGTPLQHVIQVLQTTCFTLAFVFWMLLKTIVYTYRGFHSHGGTPIAGWFIVETIKMDDLGVMIWGYPTLGSIHMLVVLKPFSHVYT